MWLSLAVDPAPVDGGGAAMAEGPPVRAEALASPTESALTESLPGAAGVADPAQLEVPELDLGWTLVRTVVVLGLVVALVYLTLNVGLRRLLGGQPLAARRLVRVVERIPLDQRRTLFVVEAAGEYLLVGGSEAGLGLVKALDREEVERRLTSATGAGPVVRVSPLLQRLLGRKDSRPPLT